MTGITIRDADPNFNDDQSADHGPGPILPSHDLLTVDVRTAADGTATVTLAGEIDLVTVATLQNRMTTLLALPLPRLVLDMRRVDFLGSSGLAVLVDLRAETQRRDIALHLVTQSRAVLRPLIATGLIELFDISAEPHVG